MTDLNARRDLQRRFGTWVKYGRKATTPTKPFEATRFSITFTQKQIIGIPDKR